MTLKEKFDAAFKIGMFLMVLFTSIMIGSKIDQITRLMVSIERVMIVTQELIELGPDSITEMGAGVQEATETVGDGIATAGETIKNRLFGSTPK